MACAIAVPKLSHPITYCPPGEARNARFDEYVGVRRKLPIQKATFDAEGVAESNGIDWGDFGRMGQFQHKLDSGRLSDTPSWATNDKQLRAVLVVYLERRAGLMKPGPGTEIQRLQRAQATLIKQTASFQVSLDKMVHRYAGILARLKETPADTEALAAKHDCATQIQNLDTVLLFNKDIAGKVLRVVHCYYRMGYTSVQVETETGLKPPHVREILWRLRKVAALLGFHNPPCRRHKRVRYSKPRVCILCGAPRGKGYKFCDACGSLYNHRAASAASTAKKKATTPPTPKRHAIVSSPEFIALFDVWRARTGDKRRHCKNGHAICAANAHVGDMRREGRYFCNECQRAYQRQYASGLVTAR
ncbi:MAG TPA: hypothetical protein VE377_09120 [Candidatus Dormibacteraeota bacterium]|nr:hypothetical protein [Candidatus Dormibacteraeota bacterium]